jgi:hypothetical protein
MKKVFVYYNLHKHKWSIRDCKTRLVIGHSDHVLLFEVKPKVSQAGRARVLREQRKNVHAGLEGYLMGTQDAYLGTTQKAITYNPYKYTGFVYKSTEEPYKGSQVAQLNHRSVTVC